MFYLRNIFINNCLIVETLQNAAKKALEMKLPLVTFTGFFADNPLNKLGDFNFWVDSATYNIVESIHQMWLLSVVDYLIEENN